MANDKDEYGWDDDLEGLPDDALRAIETQALLSTQRRDQSRVPPSASAHAIQAPPHGDPPSSDYGLDADEIQLNGETVAPGPPKNIATGAPQRFGGNTPARVRSHATTRRTVQDLAADQIPGLYRHRLARFGDNSNYDFAPPAASAAAPSQTAERWANASEDDLRRRIQELKEEIANLDRAKNQAEAEVQIRSGEATIVRDNLERVNKEYAAKLALIQKTHAEAIQSLKEEIAVVKRERDRAESVNKFLEQDLKVEAGKVKQVRRNLKDGTVNGNAAKAPATTATPKKNRVVPFGDGFEDEDVAMVSPSKSREKSRTGTPRQGSKRKRNAIEASPSKPLPLSEPQIADDGLTAPDVELEEDALADTGKEDQKFKLLTRLMNHRPVGMQVRTFEAFTKYAFPSLPDRLLSSIIYDGVALYRDESNDFATHFCRIMLSLWDRCAQEKYFPPLHVIIDTLQFVLAFEPLEKTALLTEEIVPLAQSSASLVAWTSLDDPELKQHIDLQECLSLLLSISRSCAHETESTTRFWSLISRDFIRSLLKSPLLSTLSLTLQLLATSVTPTSFGPISEFSPSDPPRDVNRLLPSEPITLIDQLTSLLHTVPNPSPPRPALWSFRLTVLQTLSSFLSSPAASTALARHRYFLGRLHVLLNAAVSSLYSTAPRTPLAGVLSRIVNLATRIAYALMTDDATKALVEREEKRKKLNAVHGAMHAHLVALTRIAFVDVDDGAAGEREEESQGVGYPSGQPPPPWFGAGARILEAGIEVEVVDMAHELLDEFLNPQEGEEVWKVFTTARTGA